MSDTFQDMHIARSSATVALVVLLALLAGCGGSTGQIELVSAIDAAETIAENPGHIVLDVRTPEEFAGGHIDGAINIDFYAADFADHIANLDPGASYVLYCRSGNRSAETAKLMNDLDFADVDEIDGGVLSWAAAGLPLAALR